MPPLRRQHQQPGAALQQVLTLAADRVMRKSDGGYLAILISCGLLIGVLFIPADATIRTAVAIPVIGGAIGLLLGSLAVCARMYRIGRKP